MLLNLLHIWEIILKHVGRRIYRTSAMLYYVRMGIENEYPICCTLHFAWDASDRRLANMDRRMTHGPAVKRGSIYAGIGKDGNSKIYVPCGYHKERHPQWKPYNTRSLNQLRLFSDKVGKL